MQDRLKGAHESPGDSRVFFVRIKVARASDVSTLALGHALSLSSMARSTSGEVITLSR